VAAAGAAALTILVLLATASGQAGPDGASDAPAAAPDHPAGQGPASGRQDPAPSQAAVGPAAARGGAPRAEASAGERPALDAYADPASLAPEEIEARRQHRLAQARRNRQGYQQHPPYSRPLRENDDLVAPEQVAPTVRPLSPPGPGGQDELSAVVRQTQDRVFLRPGSVATVGLEAAIGGEPVPAQVASATLVRWSGHPPATSEPLLAVAFSPAGPMLTASFAPPVESLGSYTGDLLLRVEVEVGGERGMLVYAFVYTGAPPAAFAGTVRDRLEAGSVVFDVGLDVRRPGRYRIQGRIDDAAGMPLALARFDGELAPGRFDVPLVLFGKIVHDEGATSPFVLRDLEGFRLLDGVYPDRETLDPLAGPYRSRAYGAGELSPAPWDGGAAPAPRQPTP
jgi:hypothetical protein